MSFLTLPIEDRTLFSYSNNSILINNVCIQHINGTTINHMNECVMRIRMAYVFKGKNILINSRYGRDITET